MDDFGSKSYMHEKMQIESYYGGGGGGGGLGPIGNGGRGLGPTSIGFHDLRCYSASYATSATQGPPQVPKEQLKKGKSTNGSTSKAWCFSDPELHRKKRVASYKVYTVEGKMKGSFRKSIRWIKGRYSKLVHG